MLSELYNNQDDYLLCDTQPLVDEALKALKSSYRVILDCEGKNLGKRYGTLSLINLRTTTPSSSKTFLIDAIRLDNSSIRPLLDFLRLPEPIKIVFDGRMDFSELYHSRGVALTGVLDLQLADVTSRSARGEDEDKQLQRLSPFIPRSDVLAQPHCYTPVQKLAGLARCLEEHGIDIPKNELSHDSWLARPLSEPYLCYAARDVYAINLLFDHFTQAGFIDYDRLLTQSQRYISIWRNERPKIQARTANHPLLPLEILDFDPYAFKEACNSCKRMLSSQCFSETAWRLANERLCWVCRALKVKKKKKKKEI